jgi:hypothetical protein
MATTLKKPTSQPIHASRSGTIRVEKRASGQFKQQLVHYFRSKTPQESADAKVRLVVEAYREATPTPRRSEVAEALLRGLQAQSSLKDAEGGNLSADEVRPLIQVNSKQAVLDRYNKGLLLGWREKQNAVRFPVWQFAAGNVLPGLVDALEALRENSELDDWAKVLFFLSPRETLRGKRPLDLLRAGKSDKVISLARSYAE